MLTPLELVKYKLSTLAYAEQEHIETGQIELYWEDEQGREFVTEESITSIAQSALDLICGREAEQADEQSQSEHFEVHASIAAIQFALKSDEGMDFLRCWNEGNFDAIRKEWPEAPEDVFIGADPMHSKNTENA
jgi:hypothetical protein